MQKGQNFSRKLTRKVWLIHFSLGHWDFSTWCPTCHRQPWPCAWYISWSCSFYISEWAAADLPFDNVQLAGRVLVLTVVILHLSVQPSHSSPSRYQCVMEAGTVAQQTSWNSVCCRCRFCLLLLSWWKSQGRRGWGWNTPHPTLQDTVELHGLNPQHRQIKIQ